MENKPELEFVIDLPMFTLRNWRILGHLDGDVDIGLTFPSRFSRWSSEDNFLVYGGQAMKNDFGGHDNHHYDP